MLCQGDSPSLCRRSRSVLKVSITGFLPYLKFWAKNTTENATGSDIDLINVVKEKLDIKTVKLSLAKNFIVLAKEVNVFIFLNIILKL